jgi:hypothetical protein
VDFAVGTAGPFGLIFAVITAIVLIAAWVILAASRFLQGGVVERPERVPQLYGYTACLIGLIWGLTSVVSIVDNALTLSAPEVRGGSEFVWEPSVSSFEAFRATYDRARQLNPSDMREAKIEPVPEAELQRRYEALRADRIRRNRVESQRAIVRGVLSLALAAAVFAVHWLWLRRRSVAPI